MRLTTLILLGVAILGIGFTGGWLFTWERYVNPMIHEQINYEELRGELLVMQGIQQVLLNFAAYQDAVRYDGQVLDGLLDTLNTEDSCTQ